MQSRYGRWATQADIEVIQEALANLTQRQKEERREERRNRVKNAAKRVGGWVMTLSFQAGIAAGMVILVPHLRELIGV